MGLSFLSESADFCDVCGVFHSGNVHAPTMMLGNHGNRCLKNLARDQQPAPILTPNSKLSPRQWRHPRSGRCRRTEDDG